MREIWAVRLQEEGRPRCICLRSLLRRPQVLEDEVWGEALRWSVSFIIRVGPP